MENIVIIGSSGHAKVIIDIVEREGRYRIAGLLDRYRAAGESAHGYQVLGQETALATLRTSHALQGVLVAIGDNFVRSEVASLARDVCPGLSFATAIHPATTVAKDVSVGEGTVIMAGAVVNPGCSIGRFCIVNTNASVDHDSVMEDFSSLAPGVTIGGNCRIGRCSAISIGAVLIHGVRIGEHTVVGAGSTVLQDQEPFAVAYGTPSKIVRSRKPGDPYL